jgi:hypothetical protein
MKEDEMGGTCSTHSGVWLNNLKGGDHLEDLDVVGRAVLEWIIMKLGRKDVDWFHLAQDREQWRALVNTR